MTEQFIQIDCDDLDSTIERYRESGYRLDMIKPADAPREGLMSRGGENVLVLQKPARKPGRNPNVRTFTLAHAQASATEWRTGRAGMMYRDLLADCMDGRVAVSLIRLTKGGQVPDYVHYHKIDFQMIYCVKGRIKVVYEDQGPPFWLETGHCVLQPPEIRRVLECTSGAEVVEVSSPAEHETWVEHELDLPNGPLSRKRMWGDQKFLRYQRGLTEPFAGSGNVIRDLGLDDASGGRVGAVHYSFEQKGKSSDIRGWFGASPGFIFVLAGEVKAGLVDTNAGRKRVETLESGDSFVLPAFTAAEFEWKTGTELLHVKLGEFR